MSFHYSANQYNDSYKAKRLGNWQYGINHPGAYPRRRCGCTYPIAFNNGHMFPGIKRSPCSSPWGDYRAWIWEETSRCDCVDRIRNPQDYDRPPCTIAVTRMRPCPVTEAQVTARAVVNQLFNPPRP
ncbi:unnamed protein product [Allacma fusca]|uniref:Cilia- and flagella-associated protein 126 n=1 Tax=Allacma fusca TaxID=39272 RepID=A0A8J2M840_9HEXA|nr:unnamed protein product [Allacma fusca]CAG7834772.1 unnamed protein product [Allacma fusca]